MNAIWFPVLWALVSLAPNLASAAEIECPRPLTRTEFTKQVEFETYRVELIDSWRIHLKGLDGEVHDQRYASQDPGIVDGVVRVGPSGGAAQSYQNPYIFNIGIDDDGAPYFAEFHELPHLFSYKTCTYGSYESRRCERFCAVGAVGVDNQKQAPNHCVGTCASYELDGTAVDTQENKRYLFDDEECFQEVSCLGPLCEAREVT